MTCYFRHLQGIFEKAGIEVTKENKKEVDKVIHKIVNARYKRIVRLPGRKLRRELQRMKQGLLPR